MNISISQSLRHTAGGTVWSFLAQALALPTGFITTVYLTHQLGPEGYGLFTLAATLIGWVSWVTASLFSRATIKFVSEADDWRSVGATTLRLHLVCGLVTTALLWLTARPIAVLLGEPKLTIYLQLFALEPLLFVLAQTHRSILIGIGFFREQAFPSAIRWLARLMLIVLLVEMGLSIFGAVLGSLGAALIELAVYRFYVRPPLFFSSYFPATRLWNYATPLFLLSLCTHLFNRVDLFVLTALGGTAAEAGIYGAAQNLSIVAGLFTLSFSPLLLSTLSCMLKNGQDHAAQKIGYEAMRLAFIMLPFAGMVSGAAPEIVILIFDSAFKSTAPLFALLIFGSVAMVFISISNVIMIAAEKPWWTFALAGPMLLLALIGHVLLIPLLGAIGAAMITTVLAGIGALAGMVAVYYYLWHLLPPLGTAVRSVLLCGLSYIAAILLPTPGFWVVPKLLTIMIMIPLSFAILGEFSSNEIAAARSALIQWIPLKLN
ncbi:MAG TPA: oligosaccharide flippase family protein [Thermodesulfobacteriota bacterium]|nr:oligosaccharide flippase family protein [Thermodesulfobacteriota bacterium]